MDPRALEEEFYGRGKLKQELQPPGQMTELLGESSLGSRFLQGQPHDRDGISAGLDGAFALAMGKEATVDELISGKAPIVEPSMNQSDWKLGNGLDLGGVDGSQMGAGLLNGDSGAEGLLRPQSIQGRGQASDELMYPMEGNAALMGVNANLANRCNNQMATASARKSSPRSNQQREDPSLLLSRQLAMNDMIQSVNKSSGTGIAPEQGFPYGSELAAAQDPLMRSGPMLGVESGSNAVSDVAKESTWQYANQDKAFLMSDVQQGQRDSMEKFDDKQLLMQMLMPTQKTQSDMPINEQDAQLSTEMANQIYMQQQTQQSETQNLVQQQLPRDMQKQDFQRQVDPLMLKNQRMRAPQAKRKGVGPTQIRGQTHPMMQGPQGQTQMQNDQGNTHLQSTMESQRHAKMREQVQTQAQMQAQFQAALHAQMQSHAPPKPQGATNLQHQIQALIHGQNQIQSNGADPTAEGLLDGLVADKASREAFNPLGSLADDRGTADTLADEQDSHMDRKPANDSSELELQLQKLMEQKEELSNRRQALMQPVAGVELDTRPAKGNAPLHVSNLERMRKEPAPTMEVSVEQFPALSDSKGIATSQGTTEGKVSPEQGQGLVTGNIQSAENRLLIAKLAREKEMGLKTSPEHQSEKSAHANPKNNEEKVSPEQGRGPVPGDIQSAENGLLRAKLAREKEMGLRTSPEHQSEKSAPAKEGNGRSGRGVGNGRKSISQNSQQAGKQRKSTQRVSRPMLEMREKEMIDRMGNRLVELHDLPLELPEEIRRRAVIEMKKIRLLQLQRKVRTNTRDVLRSLVAPIRRSGQALPTRRREHEDTMHSSVIYRNRAARQVLKQRRDMEDRQRQERKRSLGLLMEHVASFRDWQSNRIQARLKLCRDTEKYHIQKEKERERQRKKLEQDRFKALKENNEEEYMKLLEETKSDRVMHLLEQTGEYMKQLGAQVQMQKRLADDSKEGEEDAQIEEREEGKGGNTLYESMRRRRDEYYSITHTIKEEVRQPSILVGGTLKYYQLEGLKWMVSLFNNRLNGILADEMGLGKTIQTISLIAYLMESKDVQGPFLIIVPLSTMGNWAREMDLWLPSATKVVYRGDPNTRKALQLEYLKGNSDLNVLLTTYEFVVRDKKVLGKSKWRHVIVDEGHRMKNADGKLAQILATHYRSNNRLLLTGTPLQNNLTELWALLNFLLPEIFQTAENFEHWFSAPFQEKSLGGSGEMQGLNEEEKLLIINRLHQVLRPFLLRRLKSEVESQLPDKIETVIRCQQSVWQKVLYRQVQNKAAVSLGDGAGLKKFNNMIMQLKKICNHPFIFYDEDQVWTLPSSFLVRSSGKFEFLSRVLPKLFRFNHKCLIFSQMTTALDYLGTLLEHMNVKYLRLDGSTKADDRPDMLDVFNSSDEFRVFILSTRAGGLGLNLQTADTVIFLDSDWNPQMDLQAQDRVWRIGQKNEVRVFRLVSANTVEEKILEQANQKLRKDQLIIQAGKFDNKSSDAERTELLKNMLRDHKAEESNREEEGVPTEELLNKLIARGEEEFEAFMDMDKQAEELEAERKEAGVDWESHRLLVSKDELPDWVLAPDKPVEVQKEEQMGRGRRKRKEVCYTDNLTELEITNLLESGEDLNEAALAKQRKFEARVSRRLDGTSFESDVDMISRGGNDQGTIPKPESSESDKDDDGDYEEEEVKIQRRPRGRPRKTPEKTNDADERAPREEEAETRVQPPVVLNKLTIEAMNAPQGEKTPGSQAKPIKAARAATGGRRGRPKGSTRAKQIQRTDNGEVARAGKELRPAVASARRLTPRAVQVIAEANPAQATNASQPLGASSGLTVSGTSASAEPRRTRDQPPGESDKNEKPLMKPNASSEYIEEEEELESGQAPVATPRIPADMIKPSRKRRRVLSEGESGKMDQKQTPRGSKGRAREKLETTSSVRRQASVSVQPVRTTQAPEDATTGTEINTGVSQETTEAVVKEQQTLEARLEVPVQRTDKMELEKTGVRNEQIRDRKAGAKPERRASETTPEADAELSYELSQGRNLASDSKTAEPDLSGPPPSFKKRELGNVGSVLSEPLEGENSAKQGEVLDADCVADRETEKGESSRNPEQEVGAKPGKEAKVEVEKSAAAVTPELNSNALTEQLEVKRSAENVDTEAGVMELGTDVDIDVNPKTESRKSVELDTALEAKETPASEKPIKESEGGRRSKRSKQTKKSDTAVVKTRKSAGKKTKPKRSTGVMKDTQVSMENQRVVQEATEPVHRDAPIEKQEKLANSEKAGGQSWTKDQTVEPCILVETSEGLAIKESGDQLPASGPGTSELAAVDEPVVSESVDRGRENHTAGPVAAPRDGERPLLEDSGARPRIRPTRRSLAGEMAVLSGDEEELGLERLSSERVQYLKGEEAQDSGSEREETGPQTLRVESKEWKAAPKDADEQSDLETHAKRTGSSRSGADPVSSRRMRISGGLAEKPDGDAAFAQESLQTDSDVLGGPKTTIENGRTPRRRERATATLHADAAEVDSRRFAILPDVGELNSTGEAVAVELSPSEQELPGDRRIAMPLPRKGGSSQESDIKSAVKTRSTTPRKRRAMAIGSESRGDVTSEHQEQPADRTPNPFGDSGDQLTYNSNHGDVAVVDPDGEMSSALIPVWDDSITDSPGKELEVEQGTGARDSPAEPTERGELDLNRAGESEETLQPKVRDVRSGRTFAGVSSSSLLGAGKALDLTYVGTTQRQRQSRAQRSARLDSKTSQADYGQ
eukprot:CAMPEP_0184753440 /NCGR_PEP_ID=MMETSP0315-20130426/44101_1 /TAXON_ID=101924 /ORGANISM="Rhodosorus marinus, Strain UTEX LB 2760" /LENGTH=2740 /DNA_ID=CAMNT_0027232815 /DNA_START=1 /DNA_END=8224 /DNA_ORIENTATION=-